MHDANNANARDHDTDSRKSRPPCGRVVRLKSPNPAGWLGGCCRCAQCAGRSGRIFSRGWKRFMGTS